MKIHIKEFAHEWIDSWNSHDLDRILSHYSDNFEITSPMIKVTLGIETGTLKGKENIKSYFKKAFKKVPDLHFELREVAESIGSMAIYYQSVFGMMAIEVMSFDKEGKINKAIAHYSH